MAALPSGTVTFLLTDIEGSTRLWEQHPQAMKLALAKHDLLLRRAIESFHGSIIKTTGDGIHAVFETALDGINAAIEAQCALMQNSLDGEGALQINIRSRMGLHTGEAELRDGDYYGQALNRAARIMSAGHGGQILLSGITAEIVREHLPSNINLLDLGEHHLRDLSRAEQLFQIAAPGLPQDFPPLKSLDLPLNNLPIQLTSFIGREKEIEKAGQLLAHTRILTFIGPGGTGKTRLSLQLAETHLLEFKDGAWFIELAPITDPAFIISALAAAFNLHEVQGIPLIQIIKDYLRGKQLLMVLDNCEHLVEASAQLADQLLHECPNLKIVASSREALGINGETVYRVPSLPESEAVQLFVERAAKAGSRFNQMGQNAVSIAQICQRLDGIPLAIELAAARVTLFTPRQIAERLDDRFRLLTGGSRTALPRQQTLRALIDWSYQTLNETEQSALRRLAVFSGGWTVEAAEAVIGEFEALDCLAGLVNKSMVNVDEQKDQSRYYLLETIRQFAMDKLVDAGEAIKTRTLHLDYMLKFTGENKPNNLDIYLEWLDKLDGDHDNLRIALEWAVENSIEKAIRLALNVGWYWSIRDHISEALSWYGIILQKSASLTNNAGPRAAIYAQLGWMSILVGKHRDGRAAAETAIDLAKQSNNDRTVIFACCTIALASAFLGDLLAAQNAINMGEALARQKGFNEELVLIVSAHAQMIYFTTRDALGAKVYLDEAIQLSREVGYRWETAFLIFGQARLAANLGDMETARAKFTEGTDIARRIGNNRMVYSNRSELAHALRENGMIDEAYEIYKEIIPGWNDLGHRAALAHELECIGYIVARKEEPGRAVRLLSAAQTIRKVIDTPRTKVEDMEYERELAALQGMLGQVEFQIQWINGATMTMDEAIQLALRTS